MTAYLLDLNVWLALSWANHIHSDASWEWFSLQDNARFYFCRFTQLGLLRLLTTSVVMDKDVLTIGEAWKVFDRWVDDSRVRIFREPPNLDLAFRTATLPIAKQSSPKALADYYLLAISQVANAKLVTFDRALGSACEQARQPVAVLKTANRLS